MSNLSKMVSVLHTLTNEGAIVPMAERIELKRVRSGHFRLYIPVHPGLSPKLSETVYNIAEMHNTTPNAFAKAGRLVSVQFVDNDEDNGTDATPQA